VSKRNAGRRGRPRKRRSGAAPTTEAPDPAAAAANRPAASVTARRTRGARDGDLASSDRARRDPGGVGERPDAPWHPWPFSELLILVGAIGTIVGFASGAPWTLFAGLGAVLLGTLEFTIREHRAGYRSHAVLLAGVPTALLHGVIALVLFSQGARGGVLVLAPVVVDVPVFWLLYRFLRARFEDARRERVFELRRR
jgi:hypothetical protein